MNVHMLEGQSTTRPPLFTGTNFAYWKARMRIYLRCIDLDILEIVEKKYVEKASSNMTEQEKHLATLNVKAMNALICGLVPNEYNRVSTCATAHEIWEKLCVTHEGTPQVKESKISGLMHEYELFKMRPNESIDAMFSRFTNIINELHGLDKVMKNQEINYKILRSLPPAWEPKATAIEEANDLTALSLDGLVGKLKVHEKKLKEKEKEDEPKQANEEPSQKLKTIALKSKINDDSSSDSEVDVTREVAHLSRRMAKLIKYSKNFKNRSNKPSSRVGKCFECNEPGHMAKDCPKHKEKYLRYKKKKAMYAGWDESEPSDSDSDDEDAKIALHDRNVCFMAHEDEVQSESENESLLIQNELEAALEELNFEYIKLGKEHSFLLKLHEKCDSKFEKLQSSMNNAIALKDKIIGDLELKNEQLRSQTEKLRNENKVLQRNHASTSYGHHSFRKTWYHRSHAPTYRKNFVCTYCMRHGHTSTHCRVRDHIYYYGLMWVPKGTKNTNIQGPKVWVPKGSTTCLFEGSISSKT